MAVPPEFKASVIEHLRNRLTDSSFQDVQQSGILDTFEYVDSVFEDDNVVDIISEYETKTGRRLQQD